MSTVFEQESVGGPEVTPGGGGGEGWEGGEGEGREGRGWLSVKPQGDTCINAAESGARKATKQRPKIRDLRNKKCFSLHGAFDLSLILPWFGAFLRWPDHKFVVKCLKRLSKPAKSLSILTF